MGSDTSEKAQLLNNIERDTDYELTCQVDPTTLTVVIWTRHVSDPPLPGEAKLGILQPPLISEQETYLAQALTAFIRNPDADTTDWTEAALHHLGFEINTIAAALNTLRTTVRSL